jgi:hypothetical protein
MPDADVENRNPELWWQLLFAPLIFPLVIVLACLSIVALPFLVLAKRRADRQFVRKMQVRGRFIERGELEPRLCGGEGTLVVEQAHKMGSRIWWTPEDVVKAAPTEPPPEEELDFTFGMVLQPFVIWCFERYLDPDAGTALLTDLRFPDSQGFIREAVVRERFPKLAVVMSVTLSHSLLRDWRKRKINGRA